MLAHAKGNRRDLALLTLLVDSGARKREIAAVTVADLDLNSGTVRFPVSKTVISTVPLTDRAVVALGRWLRRTWYRLGEPVVGARPVPIVRQVVRALEGHADTAPLRRSFAVRYLRTAAAVKPH